MFQLCPGVQPVAREGQSALCCCQCQSLCFLVRLQLQNICLYSTFPGFPPRFQYIQCPGTAWRWVGLGSKLPLGSDNVDHCAWLSLLGPASVHCFLPPVIFSLILSWESTEIALLLQGCSKSPLEPRFVLEGQECPW